MAKLTTEEFIKKARAVHGAVEVMIVGDVEYQSFGSRETSEIL